jgi:hypothetical protein
MKKFLKCFLLGGLILLTAAGMSFAYTITWDYSFDFLNADGSTGAVVYLDIVNPDGFDVSDAFYSATDYTYIYAVANTGFDPESDNAPGVYAAIHAFNLPVVASSVTDFGTFGPVDAGNMNLFSDFDLMVVSWPLPMPGTPISEIAYGNTSDPFFIQSTFEPGEALAELMNSGESATGEVFTALITPGGGSGTNPVPEPGTLLLLGTGLVATGGIRHLRAKRKSGKS